MDTTQLDMHPFHRGAEADLFLTEIGPWKAVVKRRVRKKYRLQQLDQRIRSERTIREANALSDAKGAGVRAPSVLSVEIEDFAIAMSFVDGEIARSCPEDRGTDLHLLQRSISTSHALDSRQSEKLIREGYRRELGDKQASISFLRQKEIARRGRYFAIR